MAVKLRLQRFGSKKNPFYRVVVAEASHRRDGRYLEVLGTYDPKQTPSLVTLDEARALEWLRYGAQPTDTVKNILSKKGLIAKYRSDKTSQ